ncbi:MAG TPA: hypothetical protein VK815_07720, partial [Candidatus Acidoferrales bacterium]|nr:hypothetical protein [Candidatus Acidoferrales bacterium]
LVIRHWRSPAPPHSSFCAADHRLFHSAFAHAITPPQNLNFSRECRMQFYAIYFHFSGVGMRARPKNQKRFH